MIVAREIFRRYPSLREARAVQAARTWREEQGYRRHPRRMASWFRDMPDMRTRVFVSNLEMPEAMERCRPRNVVISLHGAAGEEFLRERRLLETNGTLVLEVKDLLPQERRGRSQSGLITLDFEGPDLGSSRAYLQWYNDESVTSTHEKYGLTIPAVGGYWTIPHVEHSPTYRTHLAVVNLAGAPYTSRLALRNEAGKDLDARVDLPVNGSGFYRLEALFRDPERHLAGCPGVLYFGNNGQPAMYYYFVGNDVLGTWRVQHL